MRPRRLDLLNFACYSGETSIPFDDLEHDLFAIAGPTGSGKSTILDAMTWALYGRTHRLGSQGLNETLMSPGATHLASTLEFASRGETYRVTRSVRKLPSGYKPDIKIERLRNDSSWATLPETEKIREANQRVENIVGLDYDSFTRAVLLPQGDFAEFLAGDAPKRREVVARLYGGDTVDRMRATASEIARNNKTHIDAATARLNSDLRDATSDNVATAKRELVALQERLAAARQDEQELERALSELRDTAYRHEQVEAARRALASIESANPSQDREALARADAAERLRNDLQSLTAHEEAVRDATATANTALATATRAQAEAKSSAQKLERAQTESDAAAKKADTATEGIATAVRQAALLERTGGHLKDRSRHNGTRIDESATQHLHDTLLQLPAILGLARQTQQQRQLLHNTMVRTAETAKDIQQADERLGALKTQGKSLRAASERASRAHADAVEQHAVDSIRDHLHEGDDCPVCNQRVQEAPAPSGVTHRIDELKEAADAANNAVNDAVSSYKSLQQHHQRLVQEQDRRKAETTTLQDALREAELAYQRAAAELPLPPEQRDDPVAAQDTLKDHLGRQHAALAHNIHELIGDHSPSEALAALQQQRRAAEQRIADAVRQHQEKQTAATQASATLETHQAAGAAARRNLQAAEERMGAMLESSPFSTPHEARAALLPPDELRALRGTIAQHNASRAQAQQSLSDASESMKGRSYDPEALPAGQQKLTAARENILKATEAIGRCKTQLETLTRLLLQADALRQSRSEEQASYDTHATLERTLRASAFQAFLLIHAQRELARQASATIRAITDGRYELTFRDDSFYVRDTWQDTQERSVRTLSGGETFVVSLALALALSDSIAGRHTLGALFLDEGFGSLDAETLNNVAEVLSGLTSTGRMVGIISHVSSLTELLPQRLLVNKSESGSQARWET